MPIKAENKKRYPKNWGEIRERIQTRAGDKCERCGVKNYAIGARDREGNWYDVNEIDNMNSDIGDDLFGEYPKIIKIICTTAHLDHTPENNEDDNLAFLCQRCHNKVDASHRKQTRRNSRNVAQIIINLT